MLAETIVHCKGNQTGWHSVLSYLLKPKAPKRNYQVWKALWDCGWSCEAPRGWSWPTDWFARENGSGYCEQAFFWTRCSEILFFRCRFAGLDVFQYNLAFSVWPCYKRYFNWVITIIAILKLWVAGFLSIFSRKFLYFIHGLFCLKVTRQVANSWHFSCCLYLSFQIKNGLSRTWSNLRTSRLRLSPWFWILIIFHQKITRSTRYGIVRLIVRTIRKNPLVDN